ncbi:MAG: hypothetical protein GKR90_04125 [Pseudomonadales bacterium]|nr:hypothetical protein [Pseudomonadales bacterium]
MNFITRLSTPDIPAYPLAIHGRLEWQPVKIDGEPREDQWQFEFTLDHVPDTHIIVPSLSILGRSHGPASDQTQPPFQFEIRCGKANPVILQRVPAEDPSQKAQGGDDTVISTHIDCWHTHQSIEQPIIRTTVWDKEMPRSALLTISSRPLTLSVEPPSAKHTVVLSRPKPISQMDADKSIRQRICSPTALAMGLNGIDVDASWQHLITMCLDPLSRAYGSWPLAIRAANAYGIHGSVEVISEWSTVTKLLDQGVPVVCSINFAKGKLSGAPLQQTGGHLVLLYGYDAENAWVLDPAAATVSDVDHRYPIDEFVSAWLHERGAAYIFCRNAHSLLN